MPATQVGTRLSHKLGLSLSWSKANVIDHGYYLKPMNFNPYLGTAHDGTSKGYNQGFVKKHMHWLYRFRYNYLPLGKCTGFHPVNKLGKHVHYLEVSTIEKMRVQIMCEETRPLLHLFTIQSIYMTWAAWKCMHYSPDLTYHNVVLWPMKSQVQQFRFTKKMRIDDPSYRYMVRSPEFFIEDPLRDLYALGVAANDPFLEYCKSKGVEKDLLVRKWGNNLQHQPHICPPQLPPKDPEAGAHNPLYIAAAI